MAVDGAVECIGTGKAGVDQLPPGENLGRRSRQMCQQAELCQGERQSDSFAVFVDLCLIAVEIDGQIADPDDGTRLGEPFARATTSIGLNGLTM